MSFEKQQQNELHTPTQSHVSSGENGIQLKGLLRGQPYAVQRKLVAFPGPYAIEGGTGARVQAKGGMGGDTGAIADHAQAGVQGSGGALPHMETIQKSFGRHDVSGIQAHAGGAAAKAADAMGAQAYATEGKVAFKDSSPDLHTTAHEAAHIIQQKGGVSLKDGVGAEGDRYEQHADAVADAVVAGKSAESLLDEMSGGGGGAGGVQMKEGDSEGITGGKVTLKEFAQREPGPVVRARAGLERAHDNSRSLAKHAELIRTRKARSEAEMLASIASGEMPRFVARVGTEESFVEFGTFGRPDREFVFATEPADLRGCKPGEALLKVGWIKPWIKGLIGKEIAVCILDTEKVGWETRGKDVNPADIDHLEPNLVGVNKLEWPEIIEKALGDPAFKASAVGVGVADDEELRAIFEVLKVTPVKAKPEYEKPVLALKVRKLLDTHYGANELYTGMGATMNTEGKLGAREVMVEKKRTGLKLLPQNHELVRLGKLSQDEFDKMAD